MTEDVLTPTPPAEPDPHFAIAPQERRFLFVDVAALRAKQLRRGALNRLATPSDPDADATVPVLPHKAERIAMEEVKRGFIQFSVPDPAAKHPKPEGEA